VTYLLDTDVFSLYLQDDANVLRAVAVRARLHRLSVSIITVQEVWDGWATAVNRSKTPERLAAVYTRLAETVEDLANWTITSLSVAAIARYESLKQQKLNVGGNDLRIAATALESGATVVTRNRRDFARVPGLVIEDWSA
jgi:tRNA(fMet)-specific endonuclease VapC